MRSKRFAAAVILCAALLGAGNRTMQRTVPPIIRLHVLAVSDKTEDQAQKLIVRDAVLAETQKILVDCEDYTEAVSLLERHLEEVLAAAESVSDRTPVHVSLTQEPYPDRQYGNLLVPAGEYTSLRVTLGSGEGHNWWCVLYPSLCDFQENGVSAVEEAMRLPLRSSIWNWICSNWLGGVNKNEQ